MQHQLYFMQDRLPEALALVDTYREFLAHNLEILLIGNPSSVQWPLQIKEKLADTIVHGRLKYHNEDAKCCRVFDLETLSVGSVSDWKPLPFDPDAQGEAQKSIVCEAMRAALGILLEHDVFDIATTSYLEVSRAASEFSYTYQPDAESTLGTIAVVVRDVFAYSRRPLWEVIDILFTALTGFPCIVDIDLATADRPFGAFSNFSRKVGFWINILVGSQTSQIRDAVYFRYAKPGLRWKNCLITKMAYVDKLRLQEGNLSATLRIVQTLSKLDQAHIALEQGVAFKACGKEICFAGPALLAQFVMSAIADVYKDQSHVETSVISSEITSRTLDQEDIHIMKQTENNEEFGRWISLPPYAFSRKTLQNFVSRQKEFRLRLATNRSGDCMFFVDEFGPWKFRDPGSIDQKQSKFSLLYQSVLAYPCHPLSKQWWQMKKDGSTLPDEPDVPMKQYPLETRDFKPSTLEAIINKPGRVLVRRTDLRGNSGRFIVVLLFIVGVLAIHFNWANRDNRLERIFDAAQLMSLIAAVVVAVIYVATHTLTSTLDWLRGVTEITDDEQLSKSLGASPEDVKIATTYEKQSLFWLSDKNSSFCPGVQLGDLVFYKPLSLGIESPHVLGGCVVEKDRGFWILQGWSFRIEHGENTKRMVQVPFEDRVYVNSNEQKPEIS